MTYQKCWWNWVQVSISSTFYKHFFIQKCLEQLVTTFSLCLYFVCERILSKRLFCKKLLKLTTSKKNFLQSMHLRRPGANLINVFWAAFVQADPESSKKGWKLDCLFCAFGIFEHKSCSWNVDEIDPKRGVKKSWTMLFSSDLQFDNPIPVWNICFDMQKLILGINFSNFTIFIKWQVDNLLLYNVYNQIFIEKRSD